jgi:MFS family permease
VPSGRPPRKAPSALVVTAQAQPLGAGFQRLWTATATANVGDGVLLVGFPLVAVGLTRSPLGVALMSTLATLPWLLVALHAGAIADRLDRRRLIVSAMALRVALLLALAIGALLGQVSLPVLYVAVALLGIIEVFADTTTQSILPMLVPRQRLGAANGRVIAAQTVANDFLGGPLAGALVSLGAAALFGAPAVLYALAAGALLTVRGAYRPAVPARTPLRTDIVVGLRYLAAAPVLRGLAALAGLLNLAGAAYLAVFVLWAVGEQSAIGLTPQGYGLLMAGLAVGGTTGSLLTEHLGRHLGEARALQGAALMLGPLFLLPVWQPFPVVAGVAFTAIGFVVAVTKVLVASVAQRLIRPDLLGRVNATYRLVGLGTMPLGAALGGVVGNLAGLRPVFLAAAATCLLATAVAVRGLTPPTLRAAHLEE